MDIAKARTRNRRSSAAYRERQRNVGAPTSRDLAGVILESFVDGAARRGGAPSHAVVAKLVAKGFDAEASQALLTSLVARRAAELAAV